MYTSADGTKFYTKAMSEGEYFLKPVKYYVFWIDGFGIDAELYDRKVRDAGKLGIIFHVKKPLKDYRTGSEVCEKGKYQISLEDMEKYGKRTTLNAKHGEQVFIPEYRCKKIG